MAWVFSPAGSGDVETRSTALRIVWVVSNEPIIATPSATPTWRTVVFAPLATRRLSFGISDRTTFVSCELAKPRPMPKSASPGSSSEKRESAA